MYDSLSRSSLRNVGQRAGLSFLLAGTLGILVACGSDDPPSRAATGGPATGQADSGPPLRGEGFERTPEFDITDRQRPIPPRTQLIDSIAGLGQAGSGGNLPTQTDAGSDAASGDNVPDASSSNPGNTAPDAATGDSGAP
jgi:hypothetical protein